jgi:hypothetical protein
VARVIRAWLEELEPHSMDDPISTAAALAFAAGQNIGLDEPTLRGARRRALLVLAAGGDPRRTFGFDDPAVGTLAADLASDARTAALEQGLKELAAAAEGLPSVAATLRELRADSSLAWSALACALLAEEVADDD